jgi:hypothetical protein
VVCFCQRAVVLALCVIGCADPPPEPPRPSASAPRTLLSPDALPEGPIDAFGLSLPAGSTLKRKTPSSITVAVHASLDETLAYVRDRATVGSERRVKKRLFLDDVALKTKPDGPRLRIALRALSSNTELVVSVEASGDDSAAESEAPPAPEDEAAPTSSATP